MYLFCATDHRALEELSNAPQIVCSTWNFVNQAPVYCVCHVLLTFDRRKKPLPTLGHGRGLLVPQRLVTLEPANHKFSGPAAGMVNAQLALPAQPCTWTR